MIQRVVQGMILAAAAPAAAQGELYRGGERVAVEGVTATAAPRLRCPNRDDPEARALWEAVRGRYSHAQDTLSYSFHTLRRTSTGPRRDIGLAGEGPPARAWLAGPGTMRRGGFHFTSAYTYAYPLQESLNPAFARWQYRSLHATDANHFVHAEFGERHHLSFVARGRDAVVLGFCPSRRGVKGTTLRGTLTVARDRSLARAEWEFRTPAPSEEAGGEVVFVPRGARPTPLLPRTGLFWRRLVGHRDGYYQEREEFVTHLFFPPHVRPERPDAWLSPR